MAHGLQKRRSMTRTILRFCLPLILVALPGALAVTGCGSTTAAVDDADGSTTNCDDAGCASSEGGPGAGEGGPGEGGPGNGTCKAAGAACAASTECCTF